MTTMLIVLVVLLCFGIVPAHSRAGWGGSGLLGVIVVVLLILLITGRL